MPYVDPMAIKDSEYIRGKESDIFSLGVILWEISSGKAPCAGETDNTAVILLRFNGFRDPEFPETPKEYFDLYTECCDDDPNRRPKTEGVYRRLNLLYEQVRSQCSSRTNEAYTSAQFSLAVYCESGEGIEGDLEKAIELYQQAAVQGNADAQNSLAVHYERGQGIEKDIKKAIELYQKAADQGNAKAQYNLAVCYEHGEGIEKDLVKAIELYQKAADGGNAKAQYNLAVCYENG